MKRPVLPFLMAAAMATCGPAARETPRTPDPGPAGDQVARDVAALDGQAIFNSVCSQCHTIDPPASAAPPMSHVARHYRDELAGEAEALARIVEWLKAPSADRSLLPAHAVERWNLMPPLSLDEDDAVAVARYVWSLAEPQPGSMGAAGSTGMGQDHMGTGQPMRMMGGRMGRDSMAGSGQAMHMMRGRMGQDSATGSGRGMGMMHGRTSEDPTTGSGQSMRMMRGSTGQEAMMGSGQGTMMHGRMGQMGARGMAGTGAREDSTAVHEGMDMHARHGASRPMAPHADTAGRHMMGAAGMCPMHRATPPDTGAVPIR